MAVSEWHIAVKLADQPLAPKSILRLPETELGECPLGGCSISHLKQLITGKLQESVPDPELIDLIYCGRKLRDDQTLDFYGIQSGSTVHVLRKSWPEPDQKPEPVDKVAAVREFRVLHTALHSSPAYRDAVFKMLGNKESLDQIIVATPGLSSDPVALGVLQDKDLFSVFADPNMLDTLIPAHPALVNAIVLVLHSVAGSTPLPAPETSSRGMSSGSYRDMPGGFLFEGLSDDEDDFHQSTRSTPSSSTSGSRPASLGYSGAAGPRPITQSELATALALASTPESSSHTPTPGTQGHSSGTSPMSSSVQSGTPITNDLFSQALQHALQASGQPSLQDAPLQCCCSSSWGFSADFEERSCLSRPCPAHGVCCSLAASSRWQSSAVSCSRCAWHSAASDVLLRSLCPPRCARVVVQAGERVCTFPRNEKYPVFYHETNSSSIYVGGEGMLYYYNFATSETYSVEFPVENGAQCLKPGSPEDNKNFITLIAKHGNKMLVCGTGACNPTCWHLAEKEKESPQDGRGLAPFTPDTNSLVIVDYPNIYSTIKKSQQNGKIPRFRRVKGDGELYTSDTVMQNPQFVKATTLRHEEPYQDKIYYFFREDNPDKSPEAPRNISRVAQLCKEDKGGTSSLSASKWTTFLKASLICVDPATKGNFNWLQDVFFVPASNWRDSKVYGLFTNTWGSSAVCVYSFGDIDNVFRTSKLKGYNGPNPEIKPGQCVPSGQHTPSETFKIADSHPEVEDRVEPLAPTRSPLFHNKHRYQKIGVHEVSASDGRQYTVLYLATDKGSIHKVVELPGGVHNIMELQVFSKKDPIQSMILDHERAMLYVGSTSKVVEIPMDMCGVYRNNCESCLLARDPYCGWAAGSCQSIYHNREVRQNLNLELWQGKCQKGEVKEAHSYQNVTVVPVVPFSRYYLNCPVESHYATYNWYHNDTLIKTCNNTHPQPDCFYFIQNVSHTHYGHYICVSEEDGFRQALVKEHLVNQLRFMSQKGQATMTLASWLQLLLMVVLVELFH